MKKFIMAIAAMAILAMTLVTVQPVFAADVMLDTPIKIAVTKQDKNGNEYTRFVISEDRFLNGVEYKTDVIVMCFGPELVAAAKQLSAGDNLKAIASTSEYKGRTNYSLVAFVQ